MDNRQFLYPSLSNDKDAQIQDVYNRVKAFSENKVITIITPSRVRDNYPTKLSDVYFVSPSDNLDRPLHELTLLKTREISSSSSPSVDENTSN